MKRIAIVANHSMLVEAVRVALRQVTGMKIIGYVNGARPVASTVAEAQPDIVLVDDMNEPSLAIQRIAEIAVAAPAARIFVLTPGTEADWLDGALDAGAHAVLSKGLAPTSFATLVREIANGNVVQRYTRRVAAPQAVQQCDSGLTNRELEILQLVAGGSPNGRIARELWVTEQTVKFHLSNIYRKLGVRNRTEAAHYAHVHRLFEPAEQRLAS